MYNNNKKLSKQQFAIEQKKVLLLAEGRENVRVPGERPDDGEDDEWSKEIKLWKWQPMNVLMNPHPGIEDQQPDPAQYQKVLRHENTRVPELPVTTGKTPAPSPSISTIEDAISGHIARSDTPKVNGYSFVSTPKPSDLGPPMMNTISPPIVPTPSPFRIAEVSEREKLAHKLAEKAQKDITARQRAYTPRLRQTTATLRTSTLRSAAIPKFASSPDVRRTLLTPAGKRLLESSTQGRRTQSGNGTTIAGKRESAAQVNTGRTPLMRTPRLKDGATPLHKK